MTIVNQAVTAILQALSSAPAVASQIERVRIRPWSLSISTAVSVRPIQVVVMNSELPTGHPYAWNAAIVVECYARSGSSTAPDVAVDALLANVYNRLLADPTLGGAVSALQPQAVVYDFDADGEQTVCATLQINVRLKSVGAVF